MADAGTQSGDGPARAHGQNGEISLWPMTFEEAVIRALNEPPPPNARDTASDSEAPATKHRRFR